MAGEQTPQPKPEIDPADYDIDASRKDLKTEGSDPNLPGGRRPDGTFLPAGGGEQPPTPPESKHPGYLVEFARDFGFTDAEIDGMSTDQLGRSVQILRTRDQARQRQLSAEWQLQNPRPTPAAPPPPPPEPEISLGIDEEEYSPEMVKLVKQTRLDSIKENRKLREELEALKAQQAQVQQTATANHLDAAFDTLGDTYEHVYGAGSGTILEQSEPDAVERRIQAIKAVARAYHIDPFKVSPKVLGAKIKEYSAKIYQPKPSTPAKPPEHDPYKGLGSGTNGGAKRFTQEDWDRGGVSRPTARQTESEPDGELKAVRNLEKRLAESGKGSSIPSESELDGFL